jgi:hypothetical protein
MSLTIEPFYSVSGQIEPNYTAGADNYNLYHETVDPNGTVNNIIGYEDNRIETRGNIINPEYDTKLRKDHFMKSNTLKKKAYFRMFMIVVIALGVSAALVYLKRFLPMVPDLVVDLLVIAILAGGVIFLINAYMDMAKRDRMDYEQIDFSYLLETKKSTKDDGTAVTDGSTYGKDTTRTVTVCMGGNCCPTGSIFVDNKCIENFTGKIEPFTPLPEFTKSM